MIIYKFVCGWRLGARIPDRLVLSAALILILGLILDIIDSGALLSGVSLILCGTLGVILSRALLLVLSAEVSAIKEKYKEGSYKTCTVVHMRSDKWSQQCIHSQVYILLHHCCCCFLPGD